MIVVKIEEKKKQMAILQRSRTEIANALREVTANFKKLGINAHINIPDIKEKLAYIIIPNTEIVKFLMRKVSAHLKKVDRNISVKGGIVDEFIAIKAICTSEINLSNVSDEVNKFIEELKKNQITSSVNITNDDYTVVNVLINYIDVSHYFGRETSKIIKQKGLKVGIASYVDSDVFVVRITSR